MISSAPVAEVGWLPESGRSDVRQKRLLTVPRVELKSRLASTQSIATRVSCQAVKQRCVPLEPAIDHAARSFVRERPLEFTSRKRHKWRRAGSQINPGKEKNDHDEDASRCNRHLYHAPRPLRYELGRRAAGLQPLATIEGYRPHPRGRAVPRSVVWHGRTKLRHRDRWPCRGPFKPQLSTAILP